MKLHIRSFLSLIVLFVLFDTTQTHENETDSKEARRGRVNGRIVKLYSGIKPHPILCTEEGFKADPTDCSVFYRCVQSFGQKYNVFRFQCGPGTVYDPVTEVCNHPSNTKRSECGGILPVQNDVDENYIDFREVPSPISTVSSLYVNTPGVFTSSTIQVTNKYTDLRNNTSLNILSTTASGQKFSEAFGNMLYWNNEHITSRIPTFSTRPPRSDKSDPCKIDGFIGDSDDCKKFYRCVNNFRGGFIRYEFKCDESTVWDDDKKSCNYAWEVRSAKCGGFPNDDNLSMSNGIEQDKPKFTNNYNAATTEYHHEKIVTDNAAANHFGEKVNNYYTSMTSESPSSNSIDNYKPQLTSNYNDATVQYFYENSATDKNPTGNYINEIQNNSYNLQPTENQMNYGLTESQIQVGEYKKDFTLAHITSTEHTSSSSTRKNDSSILFNICHQSGFVGDPNDCQKFYRCVDSGRGRFTRYDFSCSQGTVWDSSIEACNHAWAVKGCGSKLSADNLMTESGTLNPSSSKNTEDNSDNSNKDNNSDYGYLNQINQEHTKITTPKVETTFSSPTSSGSLDVHKPCPSSGFYKDSKDCKKFYKCFENGRGSFTRFEYNCGEGTSWDETIEACNHDSAVKSCKSSSGDNDTGIMTTVTLVQTTTQKNINTNDYSSIYGLEHSITTPETITTSKESANSNNRKCNRNGFMGDKEDCKKFYRCVENGHHGYIRYEFSCGHGTVWDSSIEACNHERDVEDCRSSSSNNIDDNNLEPVDGNGDIDSGYVTPSNNNPTTSSHSTVSYTTTPIPENDINNSICKTEGFIGDTENCEKFYRCVDNGNGGYNRIEFSCGEGTVWDSNIEACNHRWAVEKCGKDSNNEFSETSTHSVATITNDISETTKSPEEPSSTQNTVAQQTLSDNKCTSEGFFGSDSDCKKFYRCVDNGKGGYTKYEFNCGDGTIWDESIQACNHATGKVTCGKVTPIYDNNPRPDLTTSLSTTTIVSTTQTATINMNAPPHVNKCTSEGFMADSSDCRKFIRCVDNGKGGFTNFEFSCGEGTVWVQEIQACDHDTDETICNTSKSTTVKISTTITEQLMPSSTHASSENMVTVSSDSDHSSITTEHTNINKNDSDKCSSEGFYPNKNDCKRFYRCVDDGKGGYIKYEFTCAEGTAWDIQSQSCNYISEVNSCQNNKIPQTETKPNSDDKSESETRENMTTTKPLPMTTSAQPNQSSCTEEGFYGDIEDCKKFYRCVSNEIEGYTKYDFTCGDGTIWDQDITACNHPRDVSNPSCRSDSSSSPTSTTDNSSSPTSTTDSSSSPTSTTDSSSSTTSTISSTTKVSTDYTSAPATTSNPSTTLTIADGSTTTMQDTNSNCSDSQKDNMNNNNYTCTKAGFYADPNDCKKFYRCVDWDNNGEKFSIYHFDCGDGTIWDPALETCNHEKSVYPPRNCNGSQQQNQNNSELSSTTDIPSETESTSPYEITSTSISQSTTESKPTTTTTTTQKSTTQSSTTTQSTSTTESKPTTTTTTTTTTTQKSTTTTSRVPSTQTTSTTSSEESTTDTSKQSSTDSTMTTSTDQTTTNKEPTSSEATTTNSFETTSMTSQMTSTTEQQATTTEITTSTEEISPQTTEDQSSTMDSTTTTNGQDSSTTESNSSLNKDCPDTEDDQYIYVCPTSFKRHPKYCNMFYQCTDDNDNHEVKVAVFNCPNNTIYDESKIQCVEESKADKKCNGEITRRSRVKRLGVSYNEPVIVSKDSMACSTPGHFPFEKQEKCSPALLKCEYSKSGKLKGYVYKCPEGYVYWTISRKCEAIRKVKDCKRSSYPWDKRYDIPVEIHNVSY